jgi:hypothetical protein
MWIVIAGLLETPDVVLYILHEANPCLISRERIWRSDEGN